MPQAKEVGAAERIGEILQQPENVQVIYRQLCSRAEDYAGKHAGMHELTSWEYLAGLQLAASIQRMAVTEATQKNRDKALAELKDWLQLSKQGRDLDTCIPEDIMVYLTTWWAQQHDGCETADGSRFAAPVSMEAIVSHLAVEFDKQGRTREWNPECKRGRRWLEVRL